MPATSRFDLSGKVALVTGASRGIGSAIAEALAEHGAEVVLSSRKQADLDTEARAGRQGPRQRRGAGPGQDPFRRGAVGDPEIFDRVLAQNPMGRIGTPDEIASGVLFLASDAASCVNGEVLVIDGDGGEV